MKNLTILGDSYSTFEGCIPEGYAVYYTKAPRAETDVRAKEDTWWGRLAAETGANIVLNDSWSGSTIGYTGYANRDCSKDSSFIFRFKKLLREGFFNKNNVDTLLIFGGTNDTWANAPLGSPTFSGWKEKDLYEVLPAICYLAHAAKSNLPDVNVYFIVNTDLKAEIADCFRAVAEKYNVNALFLKEIDKRCGHPTVNGMQSIFKQVFARLKNDGLIA
ncbi:MAG: SGNH/GDSL hydrolase family protein [Candidatus Scatosoma sp.]